MSDLCVPVDCSLQGSSVHGILQARILEWVAMPSSRGSFRPRDRTHVSSGPCIGRWVLYHWRCLGSPCLTLNINTLLPHPRHASRGGVHARRHVFVCARRHARVCAPGEMCRCTPSPPCWIHLSPLPQKRLCPSFLRAHWGPGSYQGKPEVLIPPPVRVQGWCRELPHVRASGLCRSCGGTLKKEAGSTG